MCQTSSAPAALCTFTKGRLRILTLVILALCAVPSDSRAQTAEPQENAEKRSSRDNNFRMPKRPEQTEPVSQASEIPWLSGDNGIKLGVVVGILTIAVLLLGKRKDSASIPREAIEILGAVPMAARQSVQLIRFGKKLVLVESSAAGLKPISEITDPAEVERMLDLIQPRGRQR